MKSMANLMRYQGLNHWIDRILVHLSLMRFYMLVCRQKYLKTSEHSQTLNCTHFLSCDLQRVITLALCSGHFLTNIKIWWDLGSCLSTWLCCRLIHRNTFTLALCCNDVFLNKFLHHFGGFCCFSLSEWLIAKLFNYLAVVWAIKSFLLVDCRVSSSGVNIRMKKQKKILEEHIKY